MFKTSSGIGRTLEWRETAPPCEKCLLADQLKPQFHFSTCRFSDVSAFCRFRRFDVQTIFKCGFSFCLVVVVCWLDLLRPSLLYQRSVKRSVRSLKPRETLFCSRCVFRRVYCARRLVIFVFSEGSLCITSTECGILQGDRI